MKPDILNFPAVAYRCPWLESLHLPLEMLVVIPDTVTRQISLLQNYKIIIRMLTTGYPDYNVTAHSEIGAS
jgi:hypothetical protein